MSTTDTVDLKSEILAAAKDHAENGSLGMGILPIHKSGFDEAFAACRDEVHDILATKHQDFITGLSMEASLGFKKFQNGKICQGRLFFMPIRGAADIIRNLVANDEQASALQDAFYDARVLPKNERVVLLRGSLSQKGLASIQLGEMSNIVRDITGSLPFLGKNEPSILAIKSLFDRDDYGIQDNAGQVITRCLVLYRIRLHDNEAQIQLSETPRIGRRLCEDDHARFAAWGELIFDRLPGLSVSEPTALNEAITTCCLIGVRENISLETIRLGIPANQRPDFTKLTLTKDGVFITPHFGSTALPTSFVANAASLIFPSAFFHYLKQINADEEAMFELWKRRPY